MVKVFKSNKFVALILICIIFFLLTKPNLVIDSSLNAISLWSNKVFPMLFPMLILTRSVISLSGPNSNKFASYFSKLYNAPMCSLQIFILAILSGYPMGAKLIQTKLTNKEITEKQAYTMLSFCSVSGPAFMIGSVGVAILNDFIAGVIITTSNIIACLINGLIFKSKQTSVTIQPTFTLQNKTSLSEIVYDSIKSILMVAGFMILSFLLIDLLDILNIFNLLTDLSFRFFHLPKDAVVSSLKGLFEITRGASELKASTISINNKIVLLSSLIGFGGVSVLMQTKEMFASKLISYKSLLKQKLCQGILCFIVSALIVSFV